MLFEYIQKALERAQYKRLDDDGSWFAEIPGFDGVWANAKTVEECRTELKEVLEEWLVLKVRDHNDIPEIEGVEVKIKEIAAARVWLNRFRARR
jgi:predicted RNase H-like HicB family nuclease